MNENKHTISCPLKGHPNTSSNNSSLELFSHYRVPLAMSLYAAPITVLCSDCHSSPLGDQVFTFQMRKICISEILMSISPTLERYNHSKRPLQKGRDLRIGFIYPSKGHPDFGCILYIHLNFWL